MMTLATMVSVVIPTRNGGDLFKEALAQLKRQVLPLPWELVVIDSGSTDGTVEAAAAFGATVLHISPEEFNHGATRNRAIREARGDIVVLMTQDAVPADDALLAALVKPFDDPAVAGVYARQSPRPDADVLTKRNLSRWLTGRSEPEIRSVPDLVRYAAMSPMEKYLACNFDNVCSAIRRSVWERTPFLPSFFGEDIAWSKQALETGWKIAYEPHAHVIHSHDRPISYEYKRTYMCHRKLHELFGLRTIPDRKAVIRAVVHQTLADWQYIWRSKLEVSEKAEMLFRAPLLVVAGVLGQYRGARDEARGMGRRQDGV